MAVDVKDDEVSEDIGGESRDTVALRVQEPVGRGAGGRELERRSLRRRVRDTSRKEWSVERVDLPRREHTHDSVVRIGDGGAQDLRPRAREVYDIARGKIGFRERVKSQDGPSCHDSRGHEGRELKGSGGHSR